jgi:hypothetical protein
MTLKAAVNSPRLSGVTTCGGALVKKKGARTKQWDSALTALLAPISMPWQKAARLAVSSQGLDGTYRLA